MVNNTSEPDSDDPIDTNNPDNPDRPVTPRSSSPPTGKTAITFSPDQGIDASGEPGLDFSFADRKNNYAVYDGVVVETGPLYGAGYGNVVVIRSTDANGREFDALYAHFPDGGIKVSPGQKISKNDYLGPSGFAGKRGPGDSPAMQGNGAGRMSGYHTSLDFFEPNTKPGEVTAPFAGRGELIQELLDGGGGGNGGGTGGPGLTEGPKMNTADYYSLLAISALEDDDPQGRADVAQALYNRLEGHKAGSNYFQKDNSLKSHIVAKQQFEPTFYNKSDWHKIVNMETAITALIMSKKGRERNWTRDYAMKVLMETEKSLLNPELQMKAAEHVKGRTYFLGTSEQDNMQSGDVLRNPTDNFFSMWYDENNLYGQGGVPSAASIPSRMRTESMIPPDGILADKISEPAGPKGLIESLTDEEGFSGLYMKPINFLNPFDNQSKLNEIEKISSSMEDMEDGIPVQTVVVTNTIIKNQNNTRISSNTSKVNPVKSYQLAVLGA